jgi:hypothetical protein
MAAPALQVCPLCGHQDFVDQLQVGDEWIQTCDNKKEHVPFEWRPTVPVSAKGGDYRVDILNQRGIYDDLLGCMTNAHGFVEYGVIEYWFSQEAPANYKFVVDRYGHRAIKPKSYTASALLGAALGLLSREGSLLGKWGPATGYWKYNSQVGCYAPASADPDGPILSWAEFADVTLGVPVDDWPPLGFKAS